MPILTVEAIRQNPWNAVFYALPEIPGKMLLQAAFMAAGHCRDSEFKFAEAARHGRYTPPPWEDDPDNPDVHVEVEERWFAASLRRMEISRRYTRRFGEPFCGYHHGWQEYFS